MCCFKPLAIIVYRIRLSGVVNNHKQLNKHERKESRQPWKTSVKVMVEAVFEGAEEKAMMIEKTHSIAENI